MRALDHVTQDHIYTFGARENDIFAYVWARAKDQTTAVATDNIRAAIVDALADSIEGGTPVCINGRASRMLSSLTLLDRDTTIANPKTLDIYRQQIFGELSNMISAETEAIANGDGPLSASAKQYRGDDIGGDDRAFTQHLEEKIEAHIREYRDELAPNDLERLVIECRGVL